MVQTLADPDQVRRSSRMGNARLFSRRFGETIGARHLVVVVVSETKAQRHWVITAYQVSRLGQGVVEWQRN